jgi:hypothetical protein
MKTTYRRTRCLLFEQLAARHVMATMTWLGTVSDDWHTAGNWSSSSIPDNGDTAVISGGTLAIHADQTKDVALEIKAGSSTISLNGFDFTYRELTVRDIAPACRARIRPATNLPAVVDVR